eukprot:TRINITY_DN2872_c0_g1_i3.p1 TRINITY_DN2872_c0_g1~~TRINITY_DN2872_c0_g1_i3.p1  ORF type:complete len:479 (+),score=145.06 TRINITY_DN2872_c0_g1_i3:84-1520(+)
MSAKCMYAKRESFGAAARRGRALMPEQLPAIDPVEAELVELQLQLKGVSHATLGLPACFPLVHSLIGAMPGSGLCDLASFLATLDEGGAAPPESLGPDSCCVTVDKPGDGAARAFGEEGLFTSGSPARIEVSGDRRAIASVLAQQKLSDRVRRLRMRCYGIDVACDVAGADWPTRPTPTPVEVGLAGAPRLEFCVLPSGLHLAGGDVPDEHMGRRLAEFCGVRVDFCADMLAVLEEAPRRMTFASAKSVRLHPPSDVSRFLRVTLDDEMKVSDLAAAARRKKVPVPRQLTELLLLRTDCFEVAQRGQERYVKRRVFAVAGGAEEGAAVRSATAAGRSSDGKDVEADDGGSSSLVSTVPSQDSGKPRSEALKRPQCGADLSPSAKRSRSGADDLQVVLHTIALAADPLPRKRPYKDIVEKVRTTCGESALQPAVLQLITEITNNSYTRLPPVRAVVCASCGAPARRYCSGCGRRQVECP